MSDDFCGKDNQNFFLGLSPIIYPAQPVLKYQCLICGRIVSARLPHLNKNKKLGYCENFKENNYSNFSDGPLID